MKPVRCVLLVESDPECGKALLRVLQRAGHRVRLVRSARAAASAAAREAFDLAVVDLLLPGGGVELARRLSRRVPRLYLSVGARLLAGEIVEAAVGFPVLRKASVPRLLGGPPASKTRRHRAASLAGAAKRPAHPSVGVVARREGGATPGSRDPAS